MTAEQEAKARKFSSNAELMFTWDIWRSYVYGADAERANKMKACADE